MRALAGLVRRFFPRKASGWRAARTRRARQRAAARSADRCDVGGDVQASPTGQRRLAAEGSHGADEDFEHEWDNNSSRGEVERAIRLKYESQKSPDEERRDRELQIIAIKHIIHAPTSTLMFEYMDTLIQDEWTAGNDEIPGNIYTIFALDMSFHCTDKHGEFSAQALVTDISRKFGCLCVFLVQFLAPPAIFVQLYTNWSIEDHDKIQKALLVKGGNFPSMSDWFEEGGFWTTKLLALLFMIMFCVNGVFCQRDDAKAWLKIDKIINFLNRNDKMEGTCEAMMFLGAVMNSWVISWLFLDVFIVLGLAETAQDVILDAMGLAFLYNLDDVNGDLGFVDTDNWPGIQLDWMHENMRMAAAETGDDILDAESSTFCKAYLYAVTMTLSALTAIVPTLFAWTPFKVLKPDPFFEGIVTAEDMFALVNASIPAGAAALAPLVQAAAATAAPVVQAAAAPHWSTYQ